MGNADGSPARTRLGQITARTAAASKAPPGHLKGLRSRQRTMHVLIIRALDHSTATTSRDKRRSRAPCLTQRRLRKQRKSEPELGCSFASLASRSEERRVG